ncbi:MAG: hypothetical protein JW726_09355 [Anaerolineales bacterium]|nr:hypothetical protein [Anaerolineales bacterium]
MPTHVATAQATLLPTLSIELKTYLDEALALLKENTLYGDGVDWDVLHITVYDAAAGADTIADLYPVIEMALDIIGDRHGYIWAPVEFQAYYDKPTAPAPSIRQELLEGRFGYLFILTFVVGNEEAVRQFASEIQEAIHSLDAQQPCGWIIDLRYNEGENGFAMLAGLAPLLGDGVYGYHAYGNGELMEWRVEGGKMYLG